MKQRLAISLDMKKMKAGIIVIILKNNISALPVLDKSKIKGIVTMQDIIKSIN